MMSIAFYNNNAATFVGSTQNVDVSPLYNKFLPMIKSGGHILDAGCGSGRDSKAFLDLGFKVTAFDASIEMTKVTEQLIQQTVQTCTFQDFQTECAFDAIWACASLLHVPAAELPSIMLKLSSQLQAGGHFYCSFKYGDNDLERGGRAFTNATEQRLALFIKDTPLKIKELWVTEDLRPGRSGEKWLNAILVKPV